MLDTWLPTKQTRIPAAEWSGADEIICRVTPQLEVVMVVVMSNGFNGIHESS
jgi:hypothetical protein